MTAYRVVLADDHILVRQGLKALVDGVSDLKVVGEADDGLALLDLLGKVTSDLVVLDISMPHLRGIEAIREVKAIQPHLKVLILTMHKEMDLLTAAIAAGANGYVLKEDADEQLFHAIEEIRGGRMYISPKLSGPLMADWAGTVRGDRSPATEKDRLTVREREILKLTAEGKSSKEIADLLGISHRTVEHHRANLMAKLDLKRMADLVKYAISNGYL